MEGDGVVVAFNCLCSWTCVQQSHFCCVVDTRCSCTRWAHTHSTYRTMTEEQWPPLDVIVVIIVVQGRRHDVCVIWLFVSIMKEGGHT